MIKAAYTVGESLGLVVWCHDQAGPYQTIPQAGPSWQPQGQPARQPAEYVRNGTAKMLTLFQLVAVRVRLDGVTRCPNAVLHAWLKQELTTILARLPEPPAELDQETLRKQWLRWQEGLLKHFTLALGERLFYWFRFC
jgi:hypothetical protein